MKTSKTINAIETINLMEKKTYQDFNGEKPNAKDPNQIAGSPKKITIAGTKLNKKNTKVK
ncbi:MAG: hypothetical protein JHD28_07750 [Bacteroidia bacterium]|nr:hypothetical protein [Bacteroidia bacterium]